MTLDPATAAHALYRFYDTTGELLYIGITCNPGSRWRDHQRTKTWWHEITQITIEQHPSKRAVEIAERSAIQAEQPRYNIIHNRPQNPTVFDCPRCGRGAVRRTSAGRCRGCGMRLVLHGEHCDLMETTAAWDGVAWRYLINRTPESESTKGSMASRLLPISRLGELEAAATTADWTAVDPDVDVDLPLTPAEIAIIERALSTPGFYGNPFAENGVARSHR